MQGQASGGARHVCAMQGQESGRARHVCERRGGNNQAASHFYVGVASPEHHLCRGTHHLSRGTHHLCRGRTCVGVHIRERQPDQQVRSHLAQLPQGRRGGHLRVHSRVRSPSQRPPAPHCCTPEPFPALLSATLPSFLRTPCCCCCISPLVTQTLP